MMGGNGPASWERAALALAMAGTLLLVIPLYLTAFEIFGEAAAAIFVLLVMANPLIGLIVVNVLSESTFLLWWSWGLWGACRFLREGRFGWLAVAIGFGLLAYLTRPEGLLLPVALITTLLLLPLHQATRIHWPRWGRAVAFLILGPLILAGPYMAIRGGPGTKPAIARVLGLAPQAPPLALERDTAADAEATHWQVYGAASVRMLRVVRSATSTWLLPLAVLGLLAARPWSDRARIWLFFGVVLGFSAFGLIRLHATGGYSAARHALIPALILTMASANGLAWLFRQAAIPGAWFGQTGATIRPGPAIWGTILAIVVVIPNLRDLGPSRPGPFAAYYDAGAWIEQHVGLGETVLDLTDWSLFFSQRSGYRFADVYQAPQDPTTRWVIARGPHVEGHWPYSRVVREMVQGEPIATLIPPQAEPGQLQLRVYDLGNARPRVATLNSSLDTTPAHASPH
jgi:hypothetical protein